MKKDGNSFIGDCVVGKGSKITNSVIEDSIIGNNVNIGPFARIRPHSIIDDDCKIGNFVEIKNSKIGKGTKVAHLAYIGDAELGENINIGCGVIFVNYNGRSKNRTVVGDGAFIGSNCNIIAPCKIGKGAFIAAGTTVDKDIPENAFVIGRSRIEIKPGGAKKYLN